MLTFETTGFIEVNSKDIQQLCRSTAAVHLGDPEREYSSVHAVLCHYQDNSKALCRVAFYSKVLKRASVFSIKETETKSAWQHGQDMLVQLGFQLEDVNLRLSDAMLEVVLRDVPGLLTPQAARKQRTENSLSLAELQSTCDRDPDSVQGKKALLKLDAEKRLDTQSEELRQLLEAELASREAVNLELTALENQISDLGSKLEVAEALVESERQQRQMSESITDAAEKRIQELEEVLVDAETKLSKALKQTQKNAQLKKRVKKLEEELKSVEVELEAEREKQGQLLEDINATQEQMSILENEQKEATAALEEVRAERAEEKMELSRSSENLEKAEQQVQNLRADLEDAEKKAAQHAAVDEKLVDLQGRFEETQRVLKESLDLNGTLQEQLASATEQNEKTQERLRQAEESARDKSQEEKRLLDLQSENDQLALELKELHDELSQQRSICKNLEKDVLVRDKRIQKLEETLARATENVARQSDGKKESTGDDREVTSLKVDLTELHQRLIEGQQSREELENELDEAHKLIDSFEKMLRETDSASKDRRSRESSDLGGNPRVQELEEKLKVVEDQLEQEIVEQKRLAKIVSTAEKKLVEQEEALQQAQAAPVAKKSTNTTVSEPAPKEPVKTTKPFPHELRPAPSKGAIFRPDWDLEGLPCRSSKEIFKAWEAVFNVQISLEGYPSQYCVAYLVVLLVKKQKQVYLLYRLKQNKHTLVCVPAKTPNDETSLQKAIEEGLNFLKLSGFEMDDLKKEDIDNTLAPYFSGD